MKWSKPKLVITAFIVATLLILAQSSYANPNSQTHTLDTSTFHFLLDNGSRVKFGGNTIYLGDSNGLWTWIDNDGIQFNNLRMDGDSSSVWSIRVDSANVTVTSLFNNNILGFTVSAPSWTVSTTQIYCGDYGKPMYVSGASVWSYNYATNTITINVLHLSSHDIELEWVLPPALVVAIRSNFYLAFGFISLIPIVVASMILFAVIKGRENLDLSAIIALTAFFVALILGFIILWNVMNAII